MWNNPVFRGLRKKTVNYLKITKQLFVMVEDLLVKATNFLQYDSERIFWGYESQLQSSIEVFFFDYLLHFKDD